MTTPKSLPTEEAGFVLPGSSSEATLTKTAVLQPASELVFSCAYFSSDLILSLVLGTMGQEQRFRGSDWVRLL